MVADALFMSGMQTAAPALSERLARLRSVQFRYICVTHLQHTERLKLGGAGNCQPGVGVRLAGFLRLPEETLL